MITEMVLARRAFFAALILFFVVFHQEQATAQTRPNILWITIEDTSPEFIGCYGNKVAKTPNIDKLAASGVRFTNAFSTGTVCSPSRTTLITGVRTFENGTGNHRSAVRIPAWMHGFPKYLQELGYYVSNNAKTDYNVADEKGFTADAWNESSAKAGWQNRKPGQPFFSVFNFMDSHQSRTMTSPYAQYEKQVLGFLSPGEQVDENAFDLPPFYRDSPAMRKQFARVYNAIALTDKKIGELLKRLEGDHLADSTIIFFFGDHGEGIPRGKTNGIDLGYRVPFAVQIPPVYRKLFPWTAGTVTDELISFEDLAPTLIGLAGGRVPSYMHGRVLAGESRQKPVAMIELSSDRSDNGIDLVRSLTDGRYMYSRNYMAYMPEARDINYMEIGEMKKIMRADLESGTLNTVQKSLFEPRPAELLYDTQADPWETENLATDPAFLPILQRMRSELDERVLRSRDVLFLPEYELARIKGSPYEFRTDEQAYPFKSIYGAARLSGFRDEKTVAKQVSLLSDPNPVVRYWAVTGLRCQSESGWRNHRKALVSAMNDTYPPVRIGAAAIVYELDHSDVSIEALKNAIGGDDPHNALSALNYLLYSRDRRPFLELVKKVLARPGLSENVKWACEDLETGGSSGAPR